MINWKLKLPRGRKLIKSKFITIVQLSFFLIQMPDNCVIKDWYLCQFLNCYIFIHCSCDSLQKYFYKKKHLGITIKQLLLKDQLYLLRCSNIQDHMGYIVCSCSDWSCYCRFQQDIRTPSLPWYPQDSMILLDRGWGQTHLYNSCICLCSFHLLLHWQHLTLHNHL